jgi:hypothetical protein
MRNIHTIAPSMAVGVEGGSDCEESESNSKT